MAYQCVKPHRLYRRLSSSIVSSKNPPQVIPFFLTLFISLGAGIWTSHGAVPTRLRLPASCFPFSLLCLSARGQTSSGGAIKSDKMLFYSEKIMHTIACPILRENTRVCAHKKLSLRCRNTSNHHTTYSILSCVDTEVCKQQQQVCLTHVSMTK